MAKGRKPRVKEQLAINEENGSLVGFIHEESNECVENLHPEEAGPQPDCESTCEEYNYQRAAQVTQVDIRPGMVLSGITHTCSMWELGDVSDHKICDLDKKIFEQELKSAFNKIHREYEKKAIIYNCSDWTLHRQLIRLGFEKVHEYEGFSDLSPVCVFVKITKKS